MSSQTLGLEPRLRDYLVEFGVREPDVLRRLRERTAALPDSRMQISPEHGQFFHVLLRLIGAARCLEVGVFTGYSTLVTALAIPDPGTITACDISREWTDIGREFWREAGVEQKIDLRLGPALETLDGLLAEGREEAYDFAFIDADKENYAGYYERAVRLVRTGGLIAVDNTLWSGQVADPRAQDTATVAIREFNRLVAADDRVEISLLPLGDGLTLARKL